MFIARSVAQGRTLPLNKYSTYFARMPELENEAKDIYIAAYGQEVYDEW